MVDAFDMDFGSLDEFPMPEDELNESNMVNQTLTHGTSHKTKDS